MLPAPGARAQRREPAAHTPAFSVSNKGEATEVSSGPEVESIRVFGGAAGVGGIRLGAAPGAF